MLERDLRARFFLWQPAKQDTTRGGNRAVIESPGRSGHSRVRRKTPSVMLPASGPRLRPALFLMLALTLIAPTVAAADLGPQGVVRQFCQADGLGQRVSVQSWAAVAPLVGWT